MKRSALFLWVLAILTILPLVAGAEKILVSTGADQGSVEVTVYNQNLGLVKDVRKISLVKGVQELQFIDVASRIIATSVSIIPLDSGTRGFTVLEQNYEYDLLSPGKLLDKYVGKSVRLLTKNPYTGKEETVTAEVLSNNEGTPVYKIGNDITFNHPGRIIFPRIPENLIARPTLMWLIQSMVASQQNIEVAYLTDGITWRANYVLVLDEKDRRSNLSGWVTIDNKSGATYSNARLKLVAGDIHRVMEDTGIGRGVYKMAETAPAAPQLREEAFFEYHMYTLGRKTTIKQNQTKQISLIDVKNIPVKKEFLFKGATHYFRRIYSEPVTKDKVSVYVEIQNRKESNLGIPLPKGVVRVYKHDNDGSLQFAGEDAIEHTPENEKIGIRLGDAFDLTATRKQMSWEKTGKDTIETSFEIILRNHKKEDVVIKVIEPLYGDWEILDSSKKFTKEDAHRVSFEVPVKKDSETKLSYRVRIKQ